MGVARLFGQGLAARLPAVWVLTGGAVVSACGALTAAMAGTPAVAYLGFMVMGAGSSVIAPTTFSLVGQRAEPAAQARAVARATMLGYFGYFFGPPLIGAIAGEFGLRFAFVFAAGILAGVPVLARMLRG
jgi:MFS family permease